MMRARVITFNSTSTHSTHTHFCIILFLYIFVCCIYDASFAAWRTQRFCWTIFFFFFVWFKLLCAIIRCYFLVVVIVVFFYSCRALLCCVWKLYARTFPCVYVHKREVCMHTQAHKIYVQCGLARILFISFVKNIPRAAYR